MLGRYGHTGRCLKFSICRIWVYRWRWVKIVVVNRLGLVDGFLVLLRMGQVLMGCCLFEFGFSAETRLKLVLFCCYCIVNGFGVIAGAGFRLIFSSYCWCIIVVDNSCIHMVLLLYAYCWKSIFCWRNQEIGRVR